MQEQICSQFYYSSGFFDDLTVDHEKQSLELPSIAILRIE